MAGASHIGKAGELAVRSPTSFVGYWDNPEATAETLREGWLYTGDLVRRDAAGYLWFMGRKKEIIVRSGSNISPQEVEEVLYQHPDVSQAGVIGKAGIEASMDKQYWLTTSLEKCKVVLIYRSAYRY